MRVAIVGSGYVGLVTAACLAELGHSVVAIDNDKAKLAKLKAGIMPIYEPGLDVLVAGNVAAGRLAFASSIKAGVKGAEIVFIAVGTPPRASDGEADLSFVYDAAAEIAASLTAPAIVVTKSTVPVGTGDAIEAIVRHKRPSLAIPVVSNPEFLREGSALEDFMHPDRIVVGTDDTAAGEAMGQLYEALSEHCPLLLTTRRTAELIKYAANAFLATKISFINEMANLCESVGADVGSVAMGMGLDHRIGRAFLNAGPGYGGSCFPKDTLALLRTAQDYGVTLRLVEDTIAVNEARKRAMAMKIIDAAGGSLVGRKVAILGLTFKPDTDDMRAAPSLSLVPALVRHGAEVVGYDPVGGREAKKLLPDMALARDPYAACKDADVVVLLTDWAELKGLDLDRLAGRMRGRVFVDLRNAYRPETLVAAGFSAHAVGMPAQVAPARRRTASRRARPAAPLAPSL